MNPARFGSLYVKLFAAIAGATAVLTIAAYLVFSWSFERGFVQYLHRTDEVRLERLIEGLADLYTRESGWSLLAADRERWIDITRSALGLSRRTERPEGTSAGTSRPTGAQRTPGFDVPRQLPLTIDPRLMLFDRDRVQLIGRPEAAARAILKPIAVGGRTVGYLGYVPRPELVQSVERVYLERQHVAFGAIALGMVAAALLLAAGLAYWLSRRIRALARGTNALMQGDYEVRLNASGHDELSRLAADFNTLAETLNSARAARRQWIADIAHELRTPLSVLRAEIESLQDGVRPLDQSSVDSLASEAARLGRLVDDLHTLSMSELGGLSYYKEPIPLAEVVSDVLEPQRRAIGERGLALEMKLDEDATVCADETRLSQVFSNLLQNSLRYTDAPGRISVQLRSADDHVIVEWEDSAPGVPAAELSRLTDRLYRVEASRSRAGGGSGLGLAIAKAIVEGHGGTLRARASALGGIAIEITLPACIRRNGHG